MQFWLQNWQYPCRRGAGTSLRSWGRRPSTGKESSLLPIWAHAEKWFSFVISDYKKESPLVKLSLILAHEKLLPPHPSPPLLSCSLPLFLPPSQPTRSRPLVRPPWRGGKKRETSLCSLVSWGQWYLPMSTSLQAPRMFGSRQNYITDRLTIGVFYPWRSSKLLAYLQLEENQMKDVQSCLR